MTRGEFPSDRRRYAFVVPTITEVRASRVVIAGIDAGAPACSVSITCRDLSLAAAVASIDCVALGHYPAGCRAWRIETLRYLCENTVHASCAYCRGEVRFS